MPRPRPARVFQYAAGRCQGSSLSARTMFESSVHSHDEQLRFNTGHCRIEQQKMRLLILYRLTICNGATYRIQCPHGKDNANE